MSSIHIKKYFGNIQNCVTKKQENKRHAHQMMESYRHNRPPHVTIVSLNNLNRVLPHCQQLYLRKKIKKYLENILEALKIAFKLLSTFALKRLIVNCTRAENEVSIIFVMQRDCIYICNTSTQ